MAIPAAIACNGCRERPRHNETDFNRIRKELIEENKKHHDSEIKEIDRFIEERKWPMEVTDTGLRYWIYQETQGRKPIAEDIVAISYSITLLDGEAVYETTDNNPKYVRIERDDVEPGLHEALQLMRIGERAKFILPSHLAFGFSGDARKIPSNASLLYDIHLISIQ